jgi:hypothetical protein
MSRAVNPRKELAFSISSRRRRFHVEFSAFDSSKEIHTKIEYDPFGLNKKK